MLRGVASQIRKPPHLPCPSTFPSHPDLSEGAREKLVPHQRYKGGKNGSGFYEASRPAAGAAAGAAKKMKMLFHESSQREKGSIFTEDEWQLIADTVESHADASPGARDPCHLR
jgi:hypothetical protein